MPAPRQATETHRRAAAHRRRRGEVMGFLDGILKQAMGGQAESGGLAGLATLVAKNPQILTALAGLLSTKDASVGGSGGLAGLIGAFQSKGLGDMMSSWISTGPNPPVSAAQVTDVLGHETIGQFARQAGVPASEAGSILAALLPAAIDHLTPDGKVPETNTLDGSLTALLSRLER
ncbi:MAG TPA: YidB family protein [Verrucomicrobiae bacterium]|nr:YidB family protein [Verrucomicrobiae bacterium]